MGSPSSVPETHQLRLSVVIPDGESHFTLPVVTCLGRRGHRVHVVASDPEARVRVSRYAASFTVTPDEAARFDTVRRVIGRVRADVVLPVCETGVRLLQASRGELRGRVAFAPFAGTLEIGDKWRLAQILSDLGISHPPTVLYTTDAAFRRKLGAFPVLIKPRALSGGFGIREFGDPISLIRFLDAHPEMAHEYVVQSVIPGRDVGSSVLCRDGRVLAQSIQRPASARRYNTATEVEMVEHPEASDLVRRMIEALGWSGIANVDLRVDERDGSLCVLEVNPRYWSSLLASHAAGVDFPHLACLATLGVEFAPPLAAPQRFLQAKASLRAWCGRPRGDAPAFRETIWPYVIADPLPYLTGAARRRRAAHVDALPEHSIASSEDDREAELARQRF